MPESKYTRVHITLEGGLLAQKEIVSVSRAGTFADTYTLADFLSAASQAALDGFISVTGLQPPPAEPDGFDGL